MTIRKHRRAPWIAADPAHILIHARYEAIKGSLSGRANVDRYERAKKQFDMVAAADIVQACISETAIDQLVDATIKANLPPLIVTPHPEFDGDDQDTSDPSSMKPTNALPFAFQARLAVELGCDVDEDIIEVARPGRTKLNKFQRFRWQPAFSGEVRAGRAYIIADDVCTTAGTLAMLRSYIVEHGGTVIAATTLGHRDGCNQVFPIAADTLRMLKTTYTNDIEQLWQEEIGHGVESLTEGEGICLRDWPRDLPAGDAVALLQRLRDRLDQVSQKGS